MKTHLNLLHAAPFCLAILGAVTLTEQRAFSQEPAPLSPPAPPLAPPPPPGPGKGPRHHGPAAERPEPRQISEDVSGSVTQYLLNPDGEADGLLLADGTQLHFPPHMSADLIRIIKPGAKITASGEREAGRSFRAFTITDDTKHATLIESRPSTPPAPPVSPKQRQANLKPLKAQGKIKTLLSGPRGETNGAVLDDGTILHFKPEAADRLVRLLTSEVAITASGMGTENGIGRVIEIREIGRAGEASIGLPDAPPPPPAPTPAVKP